MQAEQKRHLYRLGKVSFIAGLIACVSLLICLKWLDEFRKICPVSGCGLGHRLFGDFWHTLFGISLFVAPVAALVALILGMAGRLKKQEQYKRLALGGVGLGILVLAIYLLCFIISFL